MTLTPPLPRTVKTVSLQGRIFIDQQELLDFLTDTTTWMTGTADTADRAGNSEGAERLRTAAHAINALSETIRSIR